MRTGLTSLIKENRHLKEFSAFLRMGRCKSLHLVSLKSFLWYAPQLSGISILHFLISGYTVRSGYRTDCWIVGAFCLHPEFPQGSSSGGYSGFDDWNIICLLIWRQCFSFTLPQWFAMKTKWSQWSVVQTFTNARYLLSQVIQYWIAKRKSLHWWRSCCSLQINEHKIILEVINTKERI